MSTANVANDIRDKAEQVEAHARQAVRKASPWIVRLGRFGLVAKGLVYLIVGWLAVQAAIRGGGAGATDARGAFSSLLRQPYGTVMLAVLAVGLTGYMVWRITQALFNPEREPNDVKGWSKRLFRLGSGIVYGGLAVAAARLLVGVRSKDRAPSDWTAFVMAQPFGKWLVVIGGVCILGYGVFRIVKAWRGTLKDHLVLDGYAARARSAIVALGRFGQGARGVVFVVMGVFAFFAGLHTNPDEAKGIGETLASIARASYGPFLLGAVAAGLMAYGLFQFVEARYRRITVE